MSLRYKFNILSALKKAGYNTNRIRKERLLAESTLQKLRHGEMVSTDNIERICKLLNCQPGDVLELAPDEEKNIK